MSRLRRSRTAGPGIRRVRRGTGFSYRLDGGGAVDEATRERIRALAIPPAWTDVWIAPGEDGHIQATGLDAADRRQYLYHERWRATRDRAKFERMLELAAALPAARGRVTRELRAEGLGRERVLAGAFRLLDSGGLRIGSARYTDENGSFGLSTVLGAHARVDGDTVVLRFPGKSRQAWSSEIRDADLAALVGELKPRSGRARLLAWVDEHGARHPLRPEDINEYVRLRTGVEATAKDFRTLRGTLAAARSLARTGPGESATARHRAVVAAMREAAVELGNTPAIARASYVDPRLLDRYEHGETIAPGGTGEARLRELLAG